MMIYAMKENLTKEDWGPVPVSVSEAHRLNRADNYGIFRAVNDFSPKRRITDLLKIKAWHVDMDGDKAAQKIRIESAPLWASRIVESKNGYHLYFNAVDACLGTHREIMDGLVKHFKGDARAKMVTAILREPGFLHKKDPSDPFEVREIFNSPTIRYTVEDMLYMFPIEKPRVAPVMSPSFAKANGIDHGGLTKFLDELDSERGLMALSGTPYVRGECYTFKPVSRGRKNILVNGVSTSCFIDESGRIGATPGGPTLWGWLSYFGHDGGTIYKILKERIGGGL